MWTNPDLAGAYNFGPNANEATTVKEVIDLAKANFPRGKVHFEDGTEGPHEAGLLTLDTSKACSILAIKSRWDLKETISRTMNWYQAQHRGQDTKKLCESDIIAFEEFV